MARCHEEKEVSAHQNGCERVIAGWHAKRRNCLQRFLIFDFQTAQGELEHMSHRFFPYSLVFLLRVRQGNTPLLHIPVDSMRNIGGMGKDMTHRIEQVEVKDGIIQTGRRPRNRLFVWKDPKQQRDLVVFVGEAQPPVGKYQFCRQLVTYAQEYGVERVLTLDGVTVDLSMMMVECT